jgi:transcriptional regulator with XRE-family HTH domain
VENLNQLIGENLKRIRAERSLSLDAVAKLSGVSKSMLGQIERGEVNPTISTVWRIANGLKISFSSIVSRPRQDSELIRRVDVEPLIEGDGLVRNYPVFPFDAERGFEMYAVDMDPGGYLQAEAHSAGTEEFITVHAGEMTLRVGNDEYELESGDSIRFRSDVPHAYHNPGASMARVAMVIHYPA